MQREASRTEEPRVTELGNSSKYLGNLPPYCRSYGGCQRGLLSCQYHSTSVVKGGSKFKYPIHFFNHAQTQDSPEPHQGRNESPSGTNQAEGYRRTHESSLTRIRVRIHGQALIYIYISQEMFSILPEENDLKIFPILHR